MKHVTQESALHSSVLPSVSAAAHAHLQDQLSEVLEAFTKQTKAHDCLVAQLAEALAINDAQAKELKLLQARLKEILFGSKKRERWDPNQGLLPFDGLESEAPPAQGESAATANESDPDAIRGDNDLQIKLPAKNRKHPGRNPISPLLERRTVKHEITTAELDRMYGPGNWTVIDTSTSETLDGEPAKLFVVRHVYFQYGSVNHELPPVTATLPKVIAKGKAEAGLIARIVVSKYLDGLPLYRQQSIFRREGAEITRSTMAGWMEQAGNILQPIAHALRDRIVASGVVSADETPIVVLDRSNDRGKFKGYLWGYMSPENDVYYDFRRSRSRDGPDEVLSNLIGILQSDGYCVYGRFADSNPSITLAGCWVHVRRGFYDCRNEYPKECTEALGIIHQIYRTEARLRENNASEDEILATRARETAPLIDSFEEFLGRDFPAITPGSALGKALAYASNRMTTLRVFLSHASMDPDTNRLERCMKHTALLRKNFLFFGSENGGRFGAVLITLAINCKLLGIDAWRYFQWALEMSTSTNPPSPESMTPRAWSQLRQASA